LEQLKVAVIGGGPSGLLLSAFALLASGATVDVYEGRTDPRELNDLEGRAYALGIGMRRTAVRAIDDKLWEAVKARGFESERFTLYIRGFPIKLRDKALEGGLEPSVLMYQSDLCSALLDELAQTQLWRQAFDSVWAKDCVM
jgi:kynurenine 3-monooxygenase